MHLWYELISCEEDHIVIDLNPSFVKWRVNFSFDYITSAFEAHEIPNADESF